MSHIDTPTPPPPPKRPGSSGTRLLMGLTAFAALAFAGSVGAVWYLANHVDEGEVSEGSFLRVPLSGPLLTSTPQGGLFVEPDDFPPTVTEISAAIRAAGEDERISGLLLEIDGPQGGTASFQEIRDAITAFRAADKPCIAYGGSVLVNADYNLATACDVLVLNPSGAMLVNGLAVELTYYKGMFDTLGVDAEFLHVGDFKSAIEPFEREGPSEPAAEAYDYMLDGLYGQLVAGIAEGRGVTEEVARGWIDHPVMAPTAAVERGMIDAIGYPDAVAARAPSYDPDDEDWAASLLEQVTDEELDEEAYTPLKEYLKDVRSSWADHDEKIAVIHATGNISSGDGSASLFGDAGLTDGAFSNWMEEARDDEQVKAVVVRVNSPGGAALASSNMWREVARTKAAGKPVVVSMGDYAASGGYFMSANADLIVAHPGTITGSIGVFGGKFDLSGVWTKMGMTMHTFKRGELSDLLSGSKPFSEEGRAVFQGYLDDFYKTFVTVVSEGREMTPEAVHEVAQGRVWTGIQAKERGLVDEIGGLPLAIERAAALAELEDYGLRTLPAKKGFLDLLMEDLADASAPTIQLQLPADLEALHTLEQLDRVLAGAGVACWLPGNPTIR